MYRVQSSCELRHGRVLRQCNTVPGTWSFHQLSVNPWLLAAAHTAVHVRSNSIILITISHGCHVPGARFTVYQVLVADRPRPKQNANAVCTYTQQSRMRTNTSIYVNSMLHAVTSCFVAQQLHRQESKGHLLYWSRFLF